MIVLLAFIFSINAIAADKAAPTSEMVEFEKIIAQEKTNKLEECFYCFFKKSFIDCDQKTCDERKKDVDHLIELYKKSKPAEIPCSIKAPLVLEGCQGEGCASFEYGIVIKDTNLVKAVDSNVIVQKLAEGNKVYPPFNFFTKINKLGKYRAIRKSEKTSDGVKVVRGTVFSLIRYLSEGSYSICVNDEPDEIEIYEQFEVLEPMSNVEWVEVETGSKVRGFIKLSEIKPINSAVGD